MTAVSLTGRERWWRALTLALATGYLVIGLISPTPSTRWPFVIGAVLVAGALLVAPWNRPAAWITLIVGALVPVPTTWWSAVGPLTALLILGCGTAAIRATSTHARARHQKG